MDFKNIKKVAFRKDINTGDVIAYYPDEPSLFGGLYIACSSRKFHQMHSGRGNYLLSKRANPEEYKELQAELENAGILEKPYVILTRIK